ncbi:MAG: hypothetical protein GWP06_11655 [Actinobacteria bacterium]|nr:hypothetical protein [Actinomycetota bacterium]
MDFSLVKTIKNRKILSIVWEIGKWGLVLWLLLPIRKSMSGSVAFIRIGGGILLFVLFAGKLLYDSVFDAYKRNTERNNVRDLLGMVGIVSIIALVVGVVVFSIGFFVFSYLQSANSQTE